mgnify:CR=1 FL=1
MLVERIWTGNAYRNYNYLIAMHLVHYCNRSTN